MKTLITCSLLLSSLAHAAINMQPGLWKMNMEMEGQKKMNITAEMKAAMAKMTPAQRKQMQQMMGGGSGLVDDGGIKVCYTTDMLKSEDVLNQQNKRGCKTNIVKNTGSVIVMNFKCEDGAQGDAEWNIAPTKTSGIINMVTKEGKKAKMTYKGEFEKSDCGDVKPYKHKG